MIQRLDLADTEAPLDNVSYCSVNTLCMSCCDNIILNLLQHSFCFKDYSNKSLFYLRVIQFYLTQLVNALMRGSVQHLEELNVSGNPFSSSKKSGKDSKIPQSWKQFFSSVLVLSKLNLSFCKLPPQAIK